MTQTSTTNILEGTANINVFVCDGRKELKDRVVNGYFCTISRTAEGIDERTYEKVDCRWKYVCVNEIPKNHPRYSGLSDKLNKEGL